MSNDENPCPLRQLPTLNNKIEKKIEEFYDQIQKNEIIFKIINDPKQTVGRLILYKYANDQDISKNRKVLSKIVVNYFIAQTLDSAFPLKLEADVFKQITKSITIVFPKEKDYTFYEESYSLGDNEHTSKRQVDACGYIYNAYLSIREFARSNDVIVERKRPSKTTQKNTARVVDLSILFEKLNTADADKVVEVKEVWEESRQHRIKTEFSQKNTEEIIKKFQVLLSTIGPELIQSDFNARFDKRKITTNSADSLSNQLITSWPKLCKKIVLVARNSCSKKLNDSDISEILDVPESDLEIPDYLDINDIFAKNNLIILEEHYQTLAFFVLPYLLKDYKVSKVRGSDWKPLKSEAVSSFIYHSKDHSDLPDIIKKSEEKHSLDKVNVQPYIVFCGCLKSSKCCHVIIKDITYDFSNLTEAISFLFQLFFVLNIDYPYACIHIWSFIQKYIFHMEQERRIFGNTQIKNLMSKIDAIKD